MTLLVEIGNLEIAPLDPANTQHLDSLQVDFMVPHIRLPRIISLHTPLGRQNHADFAHERFLEFCIRAKVYDVFYYSDTDTKDQYHFRLPGAMWITEKTQKTIQDAYKELQRQHPDYKLVDVATEGSELDERFHLLAWFDFWVTWALENCVKPGIRLS